MCVCVCVYEWRRLYPNGVPMSLPPTQVFGLCFSSSHYILTLLIASFRPSRSPHSSLTSLLPRFVYQPSVPYNLNSQTSTMIPTHISIFILHFALYIYFGKGVGCGGEQRCVVSSIVPPFLHSILITNPYCLQGYQPKNNHYGLPIIFCTHSA